MTDETRQKVCEFVKQTALRILGRKKRRTLEELKESYPFHPLFFGDQGLLAFANQRSIVTSMGRTLYPGVARLVAEEKFREVKLGRRRKDEAIEGDLDEGQCAKIDGIIAELYAKSRNPDHHRELQEILAVTTGSRRVVPVLPDLFIGDFPPGPLFLEIKSPLPNKDVCAESKKKILNFLALMYARGTPGAEAYLALPYNPYGTRGEYRWWPTLQFMDMNAQVLLGSEFWDKIGGPGTYQELLRILEDVRPEIAASLA